MPHRRFTDSHGVSWDVWDVDPSSAERRHASHDRRRTRRPEPDRRRNADTARVRISGELVQGWLAFQASHEKRRLTPVPDSWDQIDDAGLEALLGTATLAGRPRRLLE